MAYRFDARGRRAPLAAALAAVMFGGVGADAYAGSSGDNRKIGAKPEEVRARLYQSPLERIRAKYGLKQEQPGTDPLVGANANPGHQFKADANRGKPGKVDMDAINRLAQPKVLKSAKTESKPEVQPRRVASKAKPGRQLQSRGVDDRSDLPRPALARYGYKPAPSFDFVAQAIGGRVLRQPPSGTPIEYDDAVERPVPLEFPAIYSGVRLKDLSAAEAALALLKSDDARALVGLDAAGRDGAHERIKTVLEAPELPTDFGLLWEAMTGKTFDLAGRSGSAEIYAFEPMFKQEVEHKLWWDRVFGFKLPEAMPLQQLPYPEHIVAVVARVTDSTTLSPRYVVAYVDAGGKLAVPGGFNSPGSSESEPEIDRLQLNAAELAMTQVEYVVYEPHYYKQGHGVN